MLRLPGLGQLLRIGGFGPAVAGDGAIAASYAVAVKLTRTLSIVPLALFQTWFQNKQLPPEQRKTMVWYRLIQPFLVLFIVAAALQSIGFIPNSWTGPLKFLAHFRITMAMAAVGLSSSLTAVKMQDGAPWRLAEFYGSS